MTKKGSPVCPTGVGTRAVICLMTQTNPCHTSPSKLGASLGAAGGAGAAFPSPALLDIRSSGERTTNTPGIAPLFSGVLPFDAGVSTTGAGGDPSELALGAGDIVLLDNNDRMNMAPGEGGGTGLYTDELRFGTSVVCFRGVCGYAIDEEKTLGVGAGAAGGAGAGGGGGFPRRFM